MNIELEELRVDLKKSDATAFGCARDDLDQRFVYTVISARARGLSVGINMNPDKKCNFDCVYCEVDRSRPSVGSGLDVPAMGAELGHTLGLVHSGKIRERPSYRNLPGDLLKLRHVALSGDGEPTLCPNFLEAVEKVVHVRAVGQFSPFKMVLITNCSGFSRPEVREGLRYFRTGDEIWAKLEAGTQDYMNTVNRAEVSLENILANILLVALERPVVIQSLFPAIKGEPLQEEEMDQFALRLKELKEAGAQISLVQIYSATRPTCHWQCGHLPLRTLSRIAQKVRSIAGLKAEIF